jgi:hypothetical protein
MSGTLIAHVDSGKVPYEKLGQYSVPEATGRWKPIAHLELVDTLKNQINCNYRIAREEYAVSDNGFKLFAAILAMSLASIATHEGYVQSMSVDDVNHTKGNGIYPRRLERISFCL